VLMIEGFGNEIPEDQMSDAIMFAHREIIKLCELQEEFVRKAGVAPTEFVPPAENPFLGPIREKIYDKLRSAKQNPKKSERHEASHELKEALLAEYFPDGAETTADGKTRVQFSQAFYSVENDAVRGLLLEGKRLDGRPVDQLREVTCQ